MINGARFAVWHYTASPVPLFNHSRWPAPDKAKSVDMLVYAVLQQRTCHGYFAGLTSIWNRRHRSRRLLFLEREALQVAPKKRCLRLNAESVFLPLLLRSRCLIRTCGWRRKSVEVLLVPAVFDGGRYRGFQGGTRDIIKQESGEPPHE